MIIYRVYIDTCILCLGRPINYLFLVDQFNCQNIYIYRQPIKYMRSPAAWRVPKFGIYTLFKISGGWVQQNWPPTQLKKGRFPSISQRPKRSSFFVLLIYIFSSLHISVVTSKLVVFVYLFCTHKSKLMHVWSTIELSLHKQEHFYWSNICRYLLCCKSTSPHFKFVKLIIKLIKREANIREECNDKTNISADIRLVFEIIISLFVVL